MIDEDKLKKAFGKRVKDIRKSKKLTQEQLAEKIWIDTQHLCKMENGAHFPSLKNLVRLANALDTSPSELLNINNFKTSELQQEIINNILFKLNVDEQKFIKNMINELIKIKNK